MPRGIDREGISEGGCLEGELGMGCEGGCLQGERVREGISEGGCLEGELVRRDK